MRLFCLLAGLILPVAATARVDTLAVDHHYVAGLAKALAAAPYDADRGTVSKSYRQMSYDDYRRIRYRPENSLWAEDDFDYRVQFYHPGYIFDRSVKLHEFSGEYVQEIPFVREHFDYQDLKFPFWAKWRLGYAGFRVLNQLNENGKWDEVVSFLGASYFRALAKGQFYGISARALALNSGGPGTEEFPRFVEFWLGKPDEQDESVTIHGLLDSPSVAGAYTFVVKPGDETVMEVKATLYFRATVVSVGMAPMTSMFWFGELSPNRFGDFRPEVHDSDGLLVATDENTRIWRPLINPTSISLTDFPAASIKGFGLLQRDREFASYEDIEARYEHRPSLWMEPIGEWPEGRVRLLELPAHSEHHDNVVAFWMPKSIPVPGEGPVELAWRLRWTNSPTFGGPAGYVDATRHTLTDGAPGRTHFVIDFAPGSVSAAEDMNSPRADVVVPEGVQIVDQQVIHNPVDGSWRLSLRLMATPGAGPYDIRARLMQNEHAVSETWSMPWTP